MLSRIRLWLRKGDDIAEEVEGHLEELKEERLAMGDTQAQAARSARLKLGNRTAVEEAVREVSPLHFFEVAVRSAQMAMRTLLRQRGAYLAATGILALGIGMSIAMFSLVDAVLLRPLPFPDQKSIQVIWKANAASGNYVEELAYPELRDLQENIKDFEYVAVMPTSLYGYGRVLQRGNAEPVEIEASMVSHDFFRVLGVSPLLGRDFAGSDEQVGAPPVVMVSDRVWREQLGADRNMIGQMIRLNGQGYTVIGVLAPGVEFPRGAGLWIPLGVEQRVVERRGATFLQAIARVKPGHSWNGAVREVNALFKRLASEHPEAYAPSQQAVVTPLVEYWTGSARLHLLIMLAASLLLLLASIISADSLLLSRTLSRRPEIVTRLALGAGYGQVLSQLAAEGMAVAMIAGASGLALAQGALHLLVRWAPSDIPRLADATLDLRAFCFAAAVAAIASVACSIIPGWAATRTNVESALRESSARSSLSRRSSRSRNMFILSQAAVTVMLLAMAALLTLSYRSLMSAGIGFANRDALSMNLPMRGPGLFSGQAFDAKSRRMFYARLLNRLRESPGITSAAAVLVRPLEGPIGWERSYEFDFEAGAKDSRVHPKANYEVVTPGYFETVGTPLLEGRDFNDHDSEDSESVVIISQTLAQRIRDAGQLPLGRRMRLGGGPGWSRVIGICGDARYRSVTQSGADIFEPSLQAQAPTNYVVISGTQPTQELAALARRTLAEIDSNQALSGIATIGDLIDANTARHRFNMLLLVWFGICAAILAATGVYSVIAETLAARKGEIAIKTALGAPRHRLVREMVSSTLGFVLAGEALGIICIAAFGSLGSDLFYGVSPRDPMVLSWAGGFLFVVSALAAFCPAWIAAGDNPKAALRTG
jgi:predicted permease